MKEITINIIKLTLLIILLQISFNSYSEVININFLGYNCDNDNYDTTITGNTGDTLNFINAVPGTVNLFIFINGTIKDTVNVDQNGLILQHFLNPNDTLITIKIWTEAGCYGQNFHITNITNIRESDDTPDFFINNNLNNLIIHNTSFNKIYIYDLQGRLLLQKELLKNYTNRLNIYNIKRGIYILMFESENRILTRKIYSTGS